MQHTPEMPGPADNPSMAAAAAAAAAKALAGSDAPSNRSAWPQEGDEAYHSGYEKSRNWLPSDDPYAHMRSRYQYGEARPSPFRPHPSDQDYERRSYRPHRYDTADRRHPRGERISEPPHPVIIRQTIDMTRGTEKLGTKMYTLYGPLVGPLWF